MAFKESRKSSAGDRNNVENKGKVRGYMKLDAKSTTFEDKVENGTRENEREINKNSKQNLGSNRNDGNEQKVCKKGHPHAEEKMVCDGRKFSLVRLARDGKCCFRAITECLCDDLEGYFSTLVDRITEIKDPTISLKELREELSFKSWGGYDLMKFFCNINKVAICIHGLNGAENVKIFPRAGYTSRTIHVTYDYNHYDYFEYHCELGDADYKVKRRFAGYADYDEILTGLRAEVNNDTRLVEYGGEISEGGFYLVNTMKNTCVRHKNCTNYGFGDLLAQLKGISATFFLVFDKPNFNSNAFYEVSENTNYSYTPIELPALANSEFFLMMLHPSNSTGSVENSLPGETKTISNTVDAEHGAGIPIPRKRLATVKVQMRRRVTIPARTETVIRIPCDKTTDQLCLASELSPGVFTTNCLVRPTEGDITVGIMNATEKDYTLTNMELRMRELVDFNITTLGETGNTARQSAPVNYVRLEDKRANDRLRKLQGELRLPDDLNPEEDVSIRDLCEEFGDIFHLEGDPLTHTDTLKHRIRTKPDQAPINRKMYRLPEAQRDIIRKQVEEMLDNDIITHSKSPWNSPLLVVPKKAGPDGEKRWRVVVDFRYLNEVTVKDAFPLPRIEEILDQLGHCRYFSTLDLASGYHQVLVEDEDQEKTAFSTNYGYYEFKRMPFGLTGAPATFQRIMNHILTGLQGFKCFVYLDDIVVYGKNLAEHNNRLREVFKRIRDNSLKLQTEKCQFLRKEVVYLGHKCSQEGAMPDPSKTDCVQNFPVPKTVRQVQSFLGLVNYYRKFIPSFSKIASPINALLRKKVKFQWTPACQQAFSTLKQALVNPPLLAYPDFEKPFNLTTDASNEALGAVLSQGEIGSDRPIAYASRSLNAAERRYSTIEKEFLAVVWAVRNFRCYLLGRKFTVYTDHKP